MPTSPKHEALVALFRNRPTLAAEILRDVLGAAVPPFATASIRNTERAEVPVASYRADVVVELAGPSGAAGALLARGAVKGKAQALLAVLTGRGILVTDDARARVLTCTDDATLDRWIERALTAARAEELFDNGEA